MSDLATLSATWDAIEATGAAVTRRNVAGWPAYQVELLLLAEARRLRALGEQLVARPAPIDPQAFQLQLLLERARHATRDAA